MDELDTELEEMIAELEKEQDSNTEGAQESVENTKKEITTDGEITEEQEREQQEDAEEEKEKEEEENNESPLSIKYNGMDITFDSVEELQTFAEKKMAEPTAKDSARLFMEKHGIAEEELQLLKDIKDKDPAAIKKMLGDMDLDELDEATEYKNNFKKEEYTELDRIAETIEKDTELQQDLTSNFQYLPQDFVDEAITNPVILNDLVTASKEGILTSSIAAAIKISGTTGRRMYDVLPEVLQKEYTEKNKKTENITRTKTKTDKKEIIREKQGRVDESISDSVEDIWDMDDDDFDALLD